MIKTKFTELAGCKIPIQQAPIGGGLARPPLAIEVAETGALGMIAATGPTPEQIIERLNQVVSGASIDVPVVAAGGIGNGRAMAAALAAGAAGVRIGTRLVAANEATPIQPT